MVLERAALLQRRRGKKSNKLRGIERRETKYPEQKLRFMETW